MRANIFSKNSKILQKLEGMSTRANSLRSFLNSHVFNMYKEAQLKRWQTENVSEGPKWASLTQKYKKQKKTKFASYPGAGTKTMIATGKLVDSASGKNRGGLLKTVTDKKLTIKINGSIVPYAKYASDIRPTMKFGPDTLTEMRSAIKRYIVKGHA